MILVQVWHFSGHLQQQIMLQPNVLGETSLLWYQIIILFIMTLENHMVQFLEITNTIDFLMYTIQKKLLCVAYKFYFIRFRRRIMHYFMSIFKKVDVIVTPTTGYAYIVSNCSRNAPNCMDNCTIQNSCSIDLMWLCFHL